MSGVRLLHFTGFFGGYWSEDPLERRVLCGRNADPGYVVAPSAVSCQACQAAMRGDFS